MGTFYLIKWSLFTGLWFRFSCVMPCSLDYIRYLVMQGLGMPLESVLSSSNMEICPCRMYSCFLIQHKDFFFLAALGLHCCTSAFLVVESGGYFLVAMLGVLLVVTFLVECGLQAMRASVAAAHASVTAARRLQTTGSVVVTHGLSCPTACGVFPDQGWCLLHCKASS